MNQVSVREARNHLSQLIHRVQAGDEVVISSHGTPVARLVGVRRTDGHALLAAVDGLGKHDRPRTAAQIEAAIRAERDSWE